MNGLVYYRLLSEKNGSKFRSFPVTINLPDTWEHVRYLLEKKQGCHCEKSKTSFIVGWRHSRGQTREFYLSQPYLPKDEICRDRDAFVISLQPMHIGQQPYVPQKFLNLLKCESKHIEKLEDENKDEQVSEDERVGSMMNEAQQIAVPKTYSRDFNKQYLHPSEPTPPPPYYYICHRCGQRGHWKVECPTWADFSFVPVKELRPATGIPQSLLRLAETEEEKKSAMVDKDGNLVVYKK